MVVKNAGRCIASTIITINVTDRSQYNAVTSMNANENDYQVLSSNENGSHMGRCCLDWVRGVGGHFLYAMKPDKISEKFLHFR